MSASDRRAWRRINIDDPDEHSRLRLAWDNFEYMLETPGVVASDLEPADLDYLIADLTAIRNRGLVEVAPDDTIRTTVTQRPGELTLESVAIDRYGVEWPLSFRAPGEDASDGP
jgi:hypothetical protein